MKRPWEEGIRQEEKLVKEERQPSLAVPRLGSPLRMHRPSSQVEKKGLDDDDDDVVGVVENEVDSIAIAGDDDE